MPFLYIFFSLLVLLNLYCLCMHVNMVNMHLTKEHSSFLSLLFLFFMFIPYCSCIQVNMVNMALTKRTLLSYSFAVVLVKPLLLLATSCLSRFPC